MMKVIRWPGLIVLLALFSAVAGFFYFLAAPLVKSGIEAAGSSLVGAKVEVERVELMFHPLGLRLHNVAVTNAKKPMQNSIVLSRVALEVELAPLLLGKVIIREMSADGMRFGTARTTSGALPKKDKVVQTAEQKRAEEAAAKESWANNIELPSVDDLLAREPLKTEQLGTQFKQGYEQHQLRIEQSVAQVPDRDALKRYEDEIKAITEGRLTSVDDFLARKQKLDEIKARFKQDQQAVKAAKQTVQQARKEMLQQIDALKKAPGIDLAALKSKYKFDEVGTANLSALLFGAEAGEWAATTLEWYEKIRPYLQKDETADDQAPVKEKVPRGGRYIHFPSNDPWPSFLLRDARMTAHLERGSILLRATDVTHEQKVTGRPTLVRMDNGNIKNVDELHALLKLDHSKTPGTDSLEVRVKNLAISEVDLGLGDVELRSASLNIDGHARVQAGQLQASGKGLFVNTQFASESKSTFARELLAALDNIKQFDLIAQATGQYYKPSLSISSDLDRQLSRAFSKRLAEKQAELEQKLQVALQEKLQQYLGDSSSEIAALASLEGSLDDKLSQLSKLAQTELEDFKAQQERELKEKLDAEKAKAKAEADAKKKEAEQKAKEKLKKLF